VRLLATHERFSLKADNLDFLASSVASERDMVSFLDFITDLAGASNVIAHDVFLAAGQQKWEVSRLYSCLQLATHSGFIWPEPDGLHIHLDAFLHD
jgi:hypothetical protein